MKHNQTNETFNATNDNVDPVNFTKQRTNPKNAPKVHQHVTLVTIIIGLILIVCVSMFAGYIAQKDAEPSTIVSGSSTDEANALARWFRSLFGGSADTSTGSTESSSSLIPEVEEYLSFLIESSPHSYDMEIFNQLREQYAAHSQNLQQTLPSVYYFILGFDLNHDGDSDFSFSCFSKCQSYYDSTTHYDPIFASMYSRCFYELGRAYAQRSGSDNSERAITYFDLSDNVLRSYKLYNLVLTYDSWLISDALNLENGSAYILRKAEEMLDVAKEIHYDDMGFVYTTVASAYISNGAATEFIHYLMEAVDAYSGLRDAKGNLYDDNLNIMFCYANLGNEYVGEGNYELAIEFLTSAYELDLEMDRYYEDYYDYAGYYDSYAAEMKSYVAQNLAYAYIANEQLDEGYHFIEVAKFWIALESEESREQDLLALEVSLANYYGALGMHDEAVTILLNCLEKYETYDDFTYVDFDISIYTNLAYIYENSGDYANAIKYYTLIKECSEFRGSREKETYLNGIYRCYVAMDMNDKALEFASQYIDYLEDKTINSTSVQSAYLTRLAELKDSQIKALQNQSTYFFLVIIIGTGLLITAIVFAIIFIHKSRQIRRISNAFKHLSETDGLTDLYNRRTLDDYLSKNWEQLRSNGRSVAIAMIDVDFFKPYNDHYGHQMGDEALQSVAEVIRQGVTSNDFVARYGGEEFLIVLTDTDGEASRSAMNRIQSTLDRLNISHDYSKVSDHITISIGCYLCNAPDSCANYEEAIRKADEALYQAKLERNCVIFN